MQFLDISLCGILIPYNEIILRGVQFVNTFRAFPCEKCTELPATHNVQSETPVHLSSDKFNY